MFKSAVLKIQKLHVFFLAQRTFKVSVCGAAGGIGQPLSMLLSRNPLISQLSLYDIVNTAGVAVDLSHSALKCRLQHFTGAEQLADCLQNADLVMVAAGMPRRPGMTRDDLFHINASIVRDIAAVIAQSCANALIAIITNPVNSCVPIAAEVLKQAGVLNARHLFGVTTLDVVRARTFIAQQLQCSPSLLQLPIIGGHSGITILPLLSKCSPVLTLPPHVVDALTTHIQEAGTEVVEAKQGTGSATLSMAYAAERFANSLLRARRGERNVVECSYVLSELLGTQYLATPLLLGKDGIERNLGLPVLNEYEQHLLSNALPELQQNIKRGIDFVSDAKRGKQSFA